MGRELGFVVVPPGQWWPESGVKAAGNREAGTGKKVLERRWQEWRWLKWRGAGKGAGSVGISGLIRLALCCTLNGEIPQGAVWAGDQSSESARKLASQLSHEEKPIVHPRS